MNAKFSFPFHEHILSFGVDTFGPNVTLDSGPFG
jgi:hypothetical protein